MCNTFLRFRPFSCPFSIQRLRPLLPRTTSTTAADRITCTCFMPCAMLMRRCRLEAATNSSAHRPWSNTISPRISHDAGAHCSASPPAFRYSFGSIYSARTRVTSERRRKFHVYSEAGMPHATAQPLPVACCAHAVCCNLATRRFQSGPHKFANTKNWNAMAAPSSAVMVTASNSSFGVV